MIKMIDTPSGPARLYDWKQHRNLPKAELTKQEQRVFTYLFLTNKEIANLLNMNIRAVEKQVESIMAKLNSYNRTMAVLIGVERGYSIDRKVLYEPPVKHGKRGRPCY